jgi:hypothetical protein
MNESKKVQGTMEYIIILAIVIISVISIGVLYMNATSHTKIGNSESIIAAGYNPTSNTLVLAFTQPLPNGLKLKILGNDNISLSDTILTPTYVYGYPEYSFTDNGVINSSNTIIQASYIQNGQDIVIQTSTGSPIPVQSILGTAVTPSALLASPAAIKLPLTNYTLSHIQLFHILNSYPIPHLNFLGNNQEDFFRMCFINYSGAVYLNSEMGNNVSTPLEPSFNKSMPFLAFTQIQEINPSNISHALSILSAYKGYCSNFEPLLVGNSTFSSTTISIDGYNGYLVKFDYLNKNALNLTSTPYEGPMPNVSYYIIAVPYKNTIVRTVYWGFTGYMNVSQMEGMESQLINALSLINSTS